MNLKGIVLSEKKPVSKGYIPHGSWSWPNYRDAEMIRAGVGWGTSGTRKMGVTLAEKQERVPWGASSRSWPWWWLHKSTQGIKCHGRYTKTHKNKATWTCVKMGNLKKSGGESKQSLESTSLHCTKWRSGFDNTCELSPLTEAGRRGVHRTSWAYFWNFLCIYNYFEIKSEKNLNKKNLWATHGSDSPYPPFPFLHRDTEWHLPWELPPSREHADSPEPCTRLPQEEGTRTLKPTPWRGCITHM